MTKTNKIMARKLQKSLRKATKAVKKEKSRAEQERQKALRLLGRIE